MAIDGSPPKAVTSTRVSRLASSARFWSVWFAGPFGPEITRYRGISEAAVRQCASDDRPACKITRIELNDE